MSLWLLFDKIPAPAIRRIHPHIIFGEHENAFSNLEPSKLSLFFSEITMSHKTKGRASVCDLIWRDYRK